jgi:hypothetical protein
MRKSKRKMTYAAKKRLHARRIIALCKMIAKKDVSKNLAALVEDYIVIKLPKPLMLRLVHGDWGRPMREAMKLTVPFFA